MNFFPFERLPYSFLLVQEALMNEAFRFQNMPLIVPYPYELYQMCDFDFLPMFSDSKSHSSRIFGN